MSESVSDLGKAMPIIVTDVRLEGADFLHSSGVTVSNSLQKIFRFRMGWATPKSKNGIFLGGKK